jgi:hypothetical protein
MNKRRSQFRAYFGLAAATLVVTTGLISVGSVQGAGATTHPTYPLGKAKSCKAGYIKRTERHKVNGIEVRYVACVYAPKYRLVVTVSDLDSNGADSVGDRIVVAVTAYLGTKPVTTGAYLVNTTAPTEDAGFCGMVIESPQASPTGYCELIFSQPGEFRVTESYGYGNYANLATAAQEVTINSGGL